MIVPFNMACHCGENLFSPRQLLCHGTSVEVFREMLDADREDGKAERGPEGGIWVSWRSDPG